jgi:hypothetical protein
MRELGWARKTHEKSAAAAARLERRERPTVTPDQLAELTKLLREKLLPKQGSQASPKIEFSGSRDKGDVLRRLAETSVGPAESAFIGELSRSMATIEKTESSRPASALIREILEEPRRTREELRDCLALVPRLHLEAAAQEVELIQAARDARLSWDEISESMGFDSRQAAEQRYKRLMAGVPPLLENDHAAASDVDQPDE